MKINAEFVDTLQKLLENNNNVNITTYNPKDISDVLLYIVDSVFSERVSFCSIEPADYGYIPELETLGFKVSEELTGEYNKNHKYRKISWS